MSSGVGVSKIWKGGREQYGVDGAKVLERIVEGVAKWPILAIDTKGEG